MNIKADELASSKTLQVSLRTVIRPIYSTTIFGIYNKEGLLVGDIKQHMTSEMHTTQLKEYLITKHNWTSQTIDTIHWNALSSALKSYQPYYCTKISQLMHDWQYIGQRKNLMFDKDGLCPMQCGEIETKMHYLWCKDKVFFQRRARCQKTLQNQLKAMNTYPGITSTILRIINQVYHQEWMDTIQEHTDLEKTLKRAITQQQKLGDNSTPKGYLVKEWELTQKMWEIANKHMHLSKNNG